MKEYIEEIEQNIENIRSAIENQGVNIPEDTPLDKYADKIAEIEKPTVKIGHDILPFYCYADNEVDASNKSKPTIEWNSEKATWDITEYNDGWTQSIPSDNPNKLLYAMFVPIKEENSSDDTFAWPKAIRLQGKKGEKGEEGNDGRDGVIAGMVQYLAAHLFKIVNRNRDDVAEELTKPVLRYAHEQISNEANRHPKPNFLQIETTPGAFVYIPETVNSINTWGLNYELPSENPENYAVLKCVASYNSLSEDVDVTDPIMLSGEGVVGWIEHYCITNNNTPPGDDATWTDNEIPNEFYNLGKYYLWNKTEIEYDSGRTVITTPVMIMSSPKAVDTIECLYGQSSNISTEPDDWTENIPDDFIVLWKRETTNFTIGDPKVTITPIAVKGNPGVDILAQVKLNDIDQWSSDNMNAFIDEEYYLKKGIVVGKDLYIWNGTNDPKDWTSNYYFCESCDFYWIIIQDAFATKVQADLTETDSTMPGYIKNNPIKIHDRTITSENVEIPFMAHNYIYFNILPDEEILELDITLSNSTINSGNPVSIRLTKTNPNAYFGNYPIELRGFNLFASLGNPFLNVNVIEYTAKVRKIDFIHSNDRYIELTGEHSTLKLAILKESKNLIPGYKYKFWYDDKEYVVEAISNSTLDNKCYYENGTITVDWNSSMFAYGYSSLLVRDISTSGPIVYINVTVPEKTIWYNILENKFYNIWPYSNMEDTCSSFPSYDGFDKWLHITKYSDFRGNEINLYYTVENPYPYMKTPSWDISFDKTSFGNKVNVYFYKYVDGGASSITVDVKNSHNNTFDCHNKSNISCSGSHSNTVTVYTNEKEVKLENSSLNKIAVTANQELSLRYSDCNIVNISGGHANAPKITLDKTQTNLVMLHSPAENMTISEESCIILDEFVFNDQPLRPNTIYASNFFN